MSRASEESSCQPDNCAKKSTDDECRHADLEHGESSCWWVYPKPPDQSDEDSEETEANRPDDHALPGTQTPCRPGHTASLRRNPTDPELPVPSGLRLFLIGGTG
jgi:hypothetical protein